jgi:ferredoxin-NADP reductase
MSVQTDLERRQAAGARASDGHPLTAALPGQFVVLRLRPASDAPALLRSYSLSGEPSEARYCVSVKRETHGVAGAYFDTTVRVGDILDTSAPRGAFTLRAGDKPVILLSAGIGVTPVLAMLHALAAAGSQGEVWWIHGARDGSEHPFAEEVRARKASARRWARRTGTAAIEWSRRGARSSRRATMTSLLDRKTAERAISEGVARFGRIEAPCPRPLRRSQPMITAGDEPLTRPAG